MPNPVHPGCLQPCDRPVVKNGTTAAGSQRYRCACCLKTFTLTPKSPGRKPLGAAPMTSAEQAKRRWENGGLEKQQAYRARKTRQEG
jgi:transposase-like protein